VPSFLSYKQPLAHSFLFWNLQWAVSLTGAAEDSLRWLLPCRIKVSLHLSRWLCPWRWMTQDQLFLRKHRLGNSDRNTAGCTRPLSKPWEDCIFSRIWAVRDSQDKISGTSERVKRNQNTSLHTSLAYKENKYSLNWFLDWPSNPLEDIQITLEKPYVMRAREVCRTLVTALKAVECHWSILPMTWEKNG
jgi:hypothetical protein